MLLWGQVAGGGLVWILLRRRGRFLRDRFGKFWSWPLETGPRADLMGVVTWFPENRLILTGYPRIPFFDRWKVGKEGLAGDEDASFFGARDFVLDLHFGLRASIILGDGGVYERETGFIYMSSSSAVPFIREDSRLSVATSSRIGETGEAVVLYICDDSKSVSSTSGEDKVISFSGRVGGSELHCFTRWLLE